MYNSCFSTFAHFEKMKCEKKRFVRKTYSKVCDLVKMYSVKITPANLYMLIIFLIKRVT